MTTLDQTIQDVYDRDNEPFKHAAFSIICELAKTKSFMTSEDVWLALGETTASNKAALGQVFRNAAKAGVIVSTPVTVEGREPSMHRKPMRVWKSPKFGLSGIQVFQAIYGDGNGPPNTAANSHKATRKEPRYQIIRNAAKCKLCGGIAESKHRHDYVSCRCGAIAVDGGLDYLRRTGSEGNLIDLSESFQVFERGDKVRFKSRITPEETGLPPYIFNHMGVFIVESKPLKEDGRFWTREDTVVVSPLWVEYAD